jgi:hypothetical protein
MTWSEALIPLDTRPLFRPLLHELLGVLRGLRAGDWDRGTVAGEWRVRDVAAHLLDTGLRRLAVLRDGQTLSPDSPIHSSEDLARFVHSLNGTGVAFGRRLSPRLLVDLLEITEEWSADVIETLPLHEPALWAVSWAGEAESENWMDIGREYTERWHHQMQIRDAVGEPRLLTPRWFEPLLELSVRALPLAYAAKRAPQGTVVTLEVLGPTARVFSIVSEEARWRVVSGRPKDAAALVRVAADDFWRVFYNAVRSPGLWDRIEVQGDRELAQPLLGARSVIV